MVGLETTHGLTRFSVISRSSGGDSSRGDVIAELPAAGPGKSACKAAQQRGRHPGLGASGLGASRDHGAPEIDRTPPRPGGLRLCLQEPGRLQRLLPHLRPRAACGPRGPPIETVPVVAAARSGRSLIAQLLTMTNQLVIEDVDLLPYHLERHFRQFALGDPSVIDLTDRAKRRGAAVYLVQRTPAR
jgi:hypothetical protein